MLLGSSFLQEEVFLLLRLGCANKVISRTFLQAPRGATILNGLLTTTHLSTAVPAK